MNKKGFTLVELLAVIVILGIILLIAVPKVIGYIETNKEESFFASAKSMLRTIEYSNIESDTMSQTYLSSLSMNIDTTSYDVDNSYVYMTDSELFITLIGIGKFDGMYICDLSINTKTTTVQYTACA